MDNNIFYRVMLNDRVKIEPKYLSKTYRKYVSDRLKTSMEGVCSKHGFIKQGSIDIYKIAPGNIELVGLNGSVVFDVYYHAEVCNPLIGSVVKATVVNMNKFGILAETGGILEIIIARNSVSISHESSAMLDSIQKGQTIMVEIVGKKFELGDKKISIVGRLVSASNEVKQVASKKQSIAVAEDPVEEDPIEDDVQESDQEESDDEEEENLDESVVDLEDEEDPEILLQDAGNDFFDSDEETLGGNPDYEFYSDEDNDDSVGSGSEEEY